MNASIRKLLFGALVCSAGSAVAAPVGYSVNADGVPGDALHMIELDSGTSVERGTVQSAQGTFLDIEGMAFDASGQLWAVDDERLRLFPVGSTGLVSQAEERPLTGLGALARNDFGMTFSCEGDLYLSSVANQALYRVAMDGTATELGSLGQRISALAAYGKPARLYGLGNGLQDDQGTRDNRSLYEIDTQTGATSLIGELGPAAADYFEAGLAFASDGTLWALTDRRTATQDLGSQVLQLDPATGSATLIATTSVAGFESLAIAPPAGCSDDNDGGDPPPPGNDRWPQIPTLDVYGRLAAILLLLIVGGTALRGRS